MTEIRDLTVREISSLAAEYRRQRAAYIDERIEIEQAGGVDETISADEAAARERAAQLLNGHAPRGLTLPRTISRNSEISIELAAIDLILEALERKELVQNAIEAADFVVEHGVEWREICRDYILAAERLHVLEDRALAMRQQLRGPAPMTLELSQYIGNGRSPLGIRWDCDPMSRARTAALKAGIISEQDLRNARNA
jgi:hypothetical protein